MSYSVHPGSILGRIGTEAGRGLAEQIPKEAERYRMAQGLKQFEQEASGLSPMQQLARLSSIPGITPQMIQTFGELGKLEGVRGAGPVSTSAIPSASIGSPPASPSIPSKQDTTPPASPPTRKPADSFATPTPTPPTPVPVATPRKNETPPLPTPKPVDYNKQFQSLTKVEDVQNSRAPILTEEDKERAAFDLLQKYPKRFPGGLNEARAKVDAEEASRIKAFETAKQKRTNDITLQNETVTRFNSKLKGDLPQEIKDTFEQRAVDKVAAGKATPEQAGIVAAKEANDFIKDRDLLKTLGSYPLGKVPESLIKDLKRIRDSYASIGHLPIFVQDMKNYNGLGDHLASTVAMPLKTSISNSIPNLKSEGTAKKFANSKQLLNKVRDNWDENQSIFSLGLALSDLGWNDEEVMRQVSDMYSNNQFPLTSDQKRELDSYYRLEYTLGDLFDSMIGGVFANPKLPYREKARRYFWGKR